GLAFFLFRERENMNRIYYSQVLMLFFAMIVFFIYPTAFPRPEVEYHGFSGAMVKFLHFADTPANACPSLHVSVTFLACFGFLRERKKLFPYFLVWALLISISTLTIKQHYLWDIIAGFIMALVFYIIGIKLIKERKSI
ncbi:MAG: phosphatase PAP2 family protein, partial [Oligoflexia bacterium]|nr:phosphatase PAP2 family protein [Oligoflexia bacterium]